MKNNQIRIGAVLSYAQIFISIAVGLVYTPVLIKYLGQNEYGLYNTVASVITLIELLKLGFNHSYIRYYARYKTEKNEKAVDQLNGLFLIVFSVLGIIAFLCGWFLSGEICTVFGQSILPEEAKVARTLLLVSTINLAVSFPATVFSTIILAQERFVFIKLLTLVQTIAVPLATLPFLLSGYGSVAVVTITLIVSVIMSAITAFYVLLILKNSFKFNGFESGLLSSMLKYTVFITINSIIDYINWNVDKFLLGRYCSFASVAVYSVGYTIYTLYMNLSTAISNVFVPKIHKIVNELKYKVSERNKTLTDIFVKIGRLQFFVLALFAMGLVFFGKAFISIWAGSEYKNAYYIMLMFVLSAIVPLTQNIGIEIQRALNKHQFRSYLYLVMALVNFVMSIILCQQYGEIGAAFGTAFSLVIANGVIMNIYYHTHCGLNIIAFWTSILGMLKGIVVPLVYGIIIVKIFDIDTVFEIILHAALFTCVYFVSMWLVSLNSDEKKVIKSFFRNIAGHSYDKNKR